MDTTEIHTCEASAWNALCQSGVALIPLLASDCVMVFPGGMMLADETLRSALSGDAFQPWKKYTITDARVLPVDSNGTCALIVYRVIAEREVGDGEDKAVFNALCSSIWRRCMKKEVPEGWEMVSHQQTPV
ncbi:hypothetical protein PENFLA_c005G05307 [Penicillium flavigenum]|uniref:Uncharacterized protein n=1 Tax=Penicillium flavigenum TaxID=254877 RepID=A0A1V6TP72_9EURO|nr:hypothetical protein PENFLA_c005G05307 [Penicillium flavigenum]